MRGTQKRVNVTAHWQTATRQDIIASTPFPLLPPDHWHPTLRVVAPLSIGLCAATVAAALSFFHALRRPSVRFGCLLALPPLLEKHLTVLAVFRPLFGIHCEFKGRLSDRNNKEARDGSVDVNAQGSPSRESQINHKGHGTWALYCVARNNNSSSNSRGGQQGRGGCLGVLAAPSLIWFALCKQRSKTKTKRTETKRNEIKPKPQNVKKDNSGKERGRSRRRAAEGGV